MSEQGCGLMNGLGPYRLDADATAPPGKQVWLTWLGDPGLVPVGSQLLPIWNPGTTATFAPELRVVDAKGKLLVVQGETFIAGGTLRPGEVELCGLSMFAPPDSPTLGVAYRLTVLAHCGLQPVWFANSAWDFDGPAGDKPPAGFEDWDSGTVTMQDLNRATYVSSGGTEIGMRRLDGNPHGMPCV